MRVLLVVLFLLALACSAEAHKGWWKAYQERAEDWKRKFEDKADKIHRKFQDQAEHWSRHVNDRVKEWGGCEDHRRCDEKVKRLDKRADKLDKKLAACHRDWRTSRAELTRLGQQSQEQLATCQREVQVLGLRLEQKHAQIQTLESEAKECPVPRESSCRPVPCSEEAERPPKESPGADVDDSALDRETVGVLGSLALFAVLAIRQWLRARALADKLARVEPALEAASQQAAALEEELKREFGAPAAGGAQTPDQLTEFTHTIEDEHLGEDVLCRRLRIRCPGVSHSQIHVDGLSNGCTITIERNRTAEGEAAPWRKTFQFRPSEGSFEFQEELAELELGILTLVFISSPKPKWVFRFPQHFDLTEADREMAWMMSSDSALPARGEVVEDEAAGSRSPASVLAAPRDAAVALLEAAEDDEHEEPQPESSCAAAAVEEPQPESSCSDPASAQEPSAEVSQPSAPDADLAKQPTVIDSAAPSAAAVQADVPRQIEAEGAEASDEQHIVDGDDVTSLHSEAGSSDDLANDFVKC